MLMTMGRLRRLLREAAEERVAIEDLKPGDVFKFELDDDFTYTALMNTKPTKVKEEYTFVKGTREDGAITIVPYHKEFGSIDRVRSQFKSIDWELDGYSVWFNIRAKIDIDSSGRSIEKDWVHVTGVIGPNANRINEGYRQVHETSVNDRFGYDAVFVIRTDEEYTVKQRIAPKGIKIPDLILQVLVDNPGAPMDPNDIMRQVRKLTGQPYVPGVGMGYFTNTAKESLVSTGAIKRYGVGKSARYALSPDDEDKVPDMIVDVLIDNQNEPMAPIDVMRQVNQRLGREHIEGDGADYFSDASPASLLRAGKIEKHGTGKRATYSAVMANSMDWRPNETVPEDYYAL